MFNVTGTDITNLSDADLRTLVARLALAELRKQGCPLSSVTAGGNQDAADGGLDVRVHCAKPLAMPDFVPRPITGFQVKKPDMTASAIENEMRPKLKGEKGAKSVGEIRQAIVELARESGAYIIVSSQGSVADKPLADRRKAMRDALHGLPDAQSLHTDFYDRDRLSTWVNEYPGIAAWVRNRVGMGLSGWGSIGGWSGSQVSEELPYLFNDKTCLTDERSRQHEQLTIAEGIARLRAALSTPKHCTRLIGLSGLGKTRLVHALFESNVGGEPLDPSLAIYTDYSEETSPTAREMARQLVLNGQRAILVIDNCNPSTHAALAHICSDGESKVSLLTVEYDVRDDEPERTDVYRLRSASPDLVAAWLNKLFPDISDIDRRTIADFSDSNFRVARALAETLKSGETLGKLKSRELFERIFLQRNERDKDLLAAAEELSLFYSVDAEDTSEKSELALIGSIRAVSANSLYAALRELRGRGIAQARSRWNAVLPHAIANPLATHALQRISPVDFDRFCASLSPRMQKSLSRRLGFLHDSPEAQAVVKRWLRADGPLGDLAISGQQGVDILSNIAPVAPEMVLMRLNQELDGPSGVELLSPAEPARSHWIRLLKALAYERHMFEPAALLLARFITAEPTENAHNSARGAFSDLFHWDLSGTLATPAERRLFVQKLASSEDSGLRRCASIALNSLLAEEFISSSSPDFGARSREWGWRPTLNSDVWSWFNDAIELAVELSATLVDARNAVAREIRGLWQMGACHETLDHAAAEFAKDKPWIEGWIAFRALLRLDGGGMPESVRNRLEDIIRRLKPSDLMNQARAIVLSRAENGWDVSDGELEEGDPTKRWQKASQLAQNIGIQLAHDSKVRAEFLTELMANARATRAFECGRGLAEGAADLEEMWGELASHHSLTVENRSNIAVLGGFICEAHQRNSSFALAALDSAITSPALARATPYLQAQIAMDTDGLARLRRAIMAGGVEALDFCCIANGIVGDAPPEPLGALLLDIANLSDGVAVAIDILHMHFFCNHDAGRPLDPSIVMVGRGLLSKVDYSRKGSLHDYGLGTVIRVCCAGPEGEKATREISTIVRLQLEQMRVTLHDVMHVIKALFEAQPLAALDHFLLPLPEQRNRILFWAERPYGSPIENVDPIVLRQWANLDADIRYPLLGRAISMFTRDNSESGMVPVFLELLDSAPDKRAFIGDFWSRLQPRSWSGSLADILEQRKAHAAIFRDSPYVEVRKLIAEITPELDRWIERERMNDRAGEESFE